MLFSSTYADLKKFLNCAEVELQKCFNLECGFYNAQQIIHDQKRAMIRKVNALMESAHSLCKTNGILYVTGHSFLHHTQITCMLQPTSALWFVICCSIIACMFDSLFSCSMISLHKLPKQHYTNLHLQICADV